MRAPGSRPPSWVTAAAAGRWCTATTSRTPTCGRARAGLVARCSTSATGRAPRCSRWPPRLRARRGIGARSAPSRSPRPRRRWEASPRRWRWTSTWTRARRSAYSAGSRATADSWTRRTCTTGHGGPTRLDASASRARHCDSDTRLRGVRPEQLHLVGTQLLVLPSADVADLAIRVVVPSLTGHRVGDRLGELVGAYGGQCVERRQVAEAPGAIRVWDDGVIQPAG